MSGTRIAASSPASQFRRAAASRIVRNEPPCFGVDSRPPSRKKTRYVVPPSRASRRVIQALGMSRADTVVAVRVLLDQGEVLLGADHRPRVAGQGHHRKDAEDGVDGAALEPEIAQVSASEERAMGLEQLRRGAPTLDIDVSLLGASALRAPEDRWLFLSRLEL